MSASGLLDLPAPLWNGIDMALAWGLPVPARLLIWGMLAGLASMAIYAGSSPQQRLALLRRELDDVQRRLLRHDGSLSELGALVRTQLSLALRQLNATLWPALLGAIPLLFLLPWLSNRFALEPARGQLVQTCIVTSQPTALHWQPAPIGDPDEDGCVQHAWPAPGASILLLDASDHEWARLEHTTPTRIIAQRHALDHFIGNPAGYLRDDVPLEALHTNFPYWRWNPWLPDWLSGWESIFLTSLLLTSLVLKQRWKLH